MRCPVCNHDETRVVDSRSAGEGYTTRRRRECTKCEYRYSTMEEIELLDLMLVKSDGRREPYMREKLEAGLRRALEKRPVTRERFKALVGSIERDIQRMKNTEVTTGEIGEIVMTHLRSFDSVAYIRFASVYRSFQDVETFQKELKKLTQNRRARSK